MLRDVLSSPRVGAVVGLLEPDGRRRAVLYGASGTDSVPLSGESVFEIGSITKVFTGVLLAEMAGRGEVGLADPVQGLLPGLVLMPSYQGQEITLLDLATMTSGLPPMPANFPGRGDSAAHADYTMEEMYRFLSGYSLPRAPGTAFEYSNLVSLLGQALATRAEKPYETLLRERVLSPLGLHGTAVNLTPLMRRRMTRGHGAAGQAGPYFVAPAFEASGGLKSTANDLLTFMAANLSGRRTPLHDALRQSHRPQRRIGESGEWMGIGWGVDPQNGEHLVGFTGGTFSYSSYIGIDLVRRRGVVVLINQQGPYAQQLGVHLLQPHILPRPKRP